MKASKSGKLLRREKASALLKASEQKREGSDPGVGPLT